VKREKISDIIGRIDQKYIDEASGVTEAVRRGRFFRSWAVVAACFVLAVAIGVGAWTIGGNTPGVEIKDPPDSAAVSSNLENSDAVTSKPKEYTSFEAEAYYETMLEEGEQELKGTKLQYKMTRKPANIPEDFAKTITRTVFGVEREYTLKLVHENENLNLKIGRYLSQDGQSIEIHPVTGKILRYSVTNDTVGKPGKQRVSDEELVEKATEYLAEFTDEDVARYSIELSRDTDYCQRVSFAVKKKGEVVYRAYSIIMDYSGEFWYYIASDYNSYQEIREFSEEAWQQAEDVAKASIKNVCEENGINFEMAEKGKTAMLYSAEDSCPIINFAYTVPVSVDGETKERTIVVQVKAK